MAKRVILIVAISAIFVIARAVNTPLVSGSLYLTANETETIVGLKPVQFDGDSLGLSLYVSDTNVSATIFYRFADAQGFAEQSYTTLDSLLLGNTLLFTNKLPQTAGVYQWAYRIDLRNNNDTARTISYSLNQISWR